MSAVMHSSALKLCFAMMLLWFQAAGVSHAADHVEAYDDHHHHEHVHQHEQENEQECIECDFLILAAEELVILPAADKFVSFLSANRFSNPYYRDSVSWVWPPERGPPPRSPPSYIQ